MRASENDTMHYKAAIRGDGMLHFQVADQQRIEAVLQGNFPHDDKSVKSERRIEHWMRQVRPSDILSKLPRTVTTAMPHNEELRTLIETIVAAVQHAPEVDIVIIATAKSDRPQVVQLHYDGFDVYSAQLLGTKAWDVLPADSLQSGGTGKENERADVSPQSHPHLPWQHATLQPGQTLVLKVGSWHRVTTHGPDHGSLVINVFVPPTPTSTEAGATSTDAPVPTDDPIRHHATPAPTKTQSSLPKIRHASKMIKSTEDHLAQQACCAPAPVSPPVSTPHHCLTTTCCIHQD